MSEQYLAQRYRVLHTLGSGGMGVVWLVEDLRKDNKVMALKVMRGHLANVESDSFRAEFRNIIGVVHPNIPEVFDFGVLPAPDSSLYFTSEYIDGQPLDQLSATWSPDQLHVILVQVCRALAFLHSRQLLHRDLKPQNVLGRLTPDGKFETLQLVDFGLSARTGEDAAVAGTVDYMAPELIEGHRATAASDIYAAGMMLYRLATGRLPFEGNDPLATARRRCTEEAPPPLRFRPDLPVGLSDVISALIHIKSKERPPTARHVIALLNEREGTDYPYECDETRSAYIRSAIAVTNAREREELQRREEQLLAGGLPGHLLVISPRGLGRRRLLHDFAHQLSVDGIRVRLVESENDLRGDEYEQVFIVPDAGHLPKEPLSAAVATACDRRAWCVIGATEAPAELAEILGVHDALTLRPLDAEGVNEFVSTTFPGNTFPPGFARRLYSRSIGCVVALYSALDDLQEGGILRIGLNGWELLPGTWNVPVHPVLKDFVETTLAGLPDHARRLAYHLACSQSPLPRAVLRATLPEGREPDGDLADAIHTLESVGWIEWENDECGIVFSAVSEYLENILDDETAREIHQHLAFAWAQPELQTHARRRRERLFHDAYAGLWSLTAEEAAKTLTLALEDGDLRWARRLIEYCLQEDPPAAIRDVVLDVLAEIEYREGDLDAAATLLDAALNHGEIPVTEANLNRMARFAMIEEKLSRTDRATGILERCLTILPEGHDQRAGTVYGTLAWIAFKHGEAERARVLAEEGLLRVPPHAADAGHAILLNTVATLAFYRGDADAASLYWKRGLEINELLRDRKGVAHIYNNLGVLAAQSGDRLRARSLWKKCADIATEINDVHRLAGIYNNLGVDALETGALAEAEEHYLKALGLFRRMKSPREQVEILSNLGELSYYRADFPRAHAYLQEGVKLASTLEDYECEIEPLIYLGKLLLTLEELESAAAVLERAHRAASEVGTKKGQGQAWEGIAMLRNRRGRWSGATEALSQARLLLSEDVDPLALLHFHLTECALLAEHGSTDEAKEALALARKVADTKWDPFTAARTLVYGLLFAQEEMDTRERPRIVRQLSVYPDLLWRFHWGSARHLAAHGTVRKALEEFGRGATVLKSIASRLSERSRELYLGSPQVRRFKEEAMMLRNSIKDN